jgi:uronate dehydrogenase
MAHRILITGASGRVGRVLARAWSDVYELTLVDTHPFPDDIPVQFILADAFSVANLRNLCENQDTVIPLAISGNMHDDWDALAPGNLDGVCAMFQAVSEAGCRRVVFPSTMMIKIDPNSPYSSSKRWGEILAERYAALSPLSVICLRLGAVREATSPSIFPGMGHLDFVLTHGDLVHLFTQAVEAPGSVKYGVFWGMSANRPAVVDLLETTRVLGYHPRDDAIALANHAARTMRGRWRRLKTWARKRIIQWVT